MSSHSCQGAVLSHAERIHGKNMVQPRELNGYRPSAIAIRHSAGHFVPVIVIRDKEGNERQFPLDFQGLNRAHAHQFAEGLLNTMKGIDERGIPFW